MSDVKMCRAQRIYDAHFNQPHEPRSPEYKAGLLYLLRRKAGVTAQQLCPYALGTSQADAWFAGCDAGHLLWRNARELAHGH